MKKFAVSLLTLAFLTFGVGTAFGATTAAPDPAKLAEIKALHQQMVELKVQMIDKKVEAGILEKEKAEKIKEAIKERQKKVEEDLAKQPKVDNKGTPETTTSSSIRLLPK